MEDMTPWGAPLQLMLNRETALRQQAVATAFLETGFHHKETLTLEEARQLAELAVLNALTLTRDL